MYGSGISKMTEIKPKDIVKASEQEEEFTRQAEADNSIGENDNTIDGQNGENR